MDNAFDLKEIFNFKNQNYEHLKSIHSSDNLFEDPIFPAIQSSLTKNSLGFDIEWKRPKVYNFLIF